MRRQIISKTGTGTTAWIPVNSQQGPFNMGFGCVVSGTITYTVEHTFDDIFNTTVTPTAFSHIIVYNANNNQDGNYAYPVSAIRLNVTAGSGTVTLTLMQGN